MVGPETIDAWIAQLNAEHRRNCGEMSADKAKNMLVLCSCVESAVTAYLIKHRLETDHGKK